MIYSFGIIDKPVLIKSMYSLCNTVRRRQTYVQCVHKTANLKMN